MLIMYWYFLCCAFYQPTCSRVLVALQEEEAYCPRKLNPTSTVGRPTASGSEVALFIHIYTMKGLFLFFVFLSGGCRESSGQRLPLLRVAPFVGVLFISAAVERRSANHVDITEEQSVAVGNPDNNLRMSVDFSSIMPGGSKRMYDARRSECHVLYNNVTVFYLLRGLGSIR